MRLESNKVRLVNHEQIKMAVSVFVDHGFSKENIRSKIDTIFNVDSNQLDEVLNSSDGLDLDVGKEKLGNGRFEELKLMVAAKYWDEVSENKFQ